MGMMGKTYSTRLYSVPFQDFAISSTIAAAFDLMTITGGSSNRTEIAGLKFGQKSTAPATIQQLDVLFLRGTTLGSGGAAITPVNLKGWAAAAAAAASVEGPSSAAASTAGATLMMADNSDVSGHYNYTPVEYEEIELDVNQTLTIRVNAPSLLATISGTLFIRELTSRS